MSEDTPRPPYLTLSIPQALSLPEPAAPEVQRWQTIIELLGHRAAHQESQVAAGFAELQDAASGQWKASTLSEPSNRGYA